MSLPKEQATAVWNLLWLSVPAVDALPEHGKTAAWYRHYQPMPGAARAFAADA